MCYDATSSLVGACCGYGVAAYLLRRDNPRLKWGAVALMGITAMQWTEAILWLDGPTPHGMVNQLVTVALIPLALLAQAWGPLFGSAFDRPVRERRVPFYFLLIVGLVFVVAVRAIYHPTHTQITPEGHLNWYSPQNPPVFAAWGYGLWAVVIGAPFLLWWRPFWQSVAIVAWGWLWAVIAFLISDSAASYWCFFVTFYAAFILIYSFMVSDEPKAKEGSPVTR
ncbi:MAG: hypothetical protein ACL93V_09270 [Candidatus Electrothrix sp. YB6]